MSIYIGICSFIFTSTQSKSDYLKEDFLNSAVFFSTKPNTNFFFLVGRCCCTLFLFLFQHILGLFAIIIIGLSSFQIFFFWLNGSNPPTIIHCLGFCFFLLLFGSIQYHKEYDLLLFHTIFILFLSFSEFIILFIFNIDQTKTCWVIQFE